MRFIILQIIFVSNKLNARIENWKDRKKKMEQTVLSKNNKKQKCLTTKTNFFFHFELD